MTVILNNLQRHVSGLKSHLQAEYKAIYTIYNTMALYFIHSFILIYLYFSLIYII